MPTAFFKFVRDTLCGKVIAKEKDPNVDVADPKSFMQAFEGRSFSPYLDGKKIPTIGIGINLTKLDPRTKAALIKGVRAWYVSQNKIPPTDDAAIINDLIDNAKKAGPHINIQKIQALSEASVDEIFNVSYNEHARTAKRLLPTLDALGARAKIAVVSLTYTTADFEGFYEALRKPDYLVAAFELVDSKRTTQEPGYKTRTEAEFQNLLAGREKELGKSLKKC